MLRTNDASPPHTLLLGEDRLTLDGLVSVAAGGAQVGTGAVDAGLERSRGHLAAALARGEAVCGVTTGYREACGSRWMERWVLGEDRFGEAP